MPPPPPKPPLRNVAMEKAYNKKVGAVLRVFAEGERIAARIGYILYNVHLDDGRLRSLHCNQFGSTAVPEDSTGELPFDTLVDGTPPSTSTGPTRHTRRNWRKGTRTSLVQTRARMREDL